ncbi:hypothetical protein ROG8370_00642 [Roseovarius gaetbuli]|uniref:N6 adenine-specific DNA methyltransferase N-terminal domain-containing protein n=1 Tax=Roseovarius gaetbuli TaxID=1356575 RepID=A0A1X6YGZ9_9RHOB|nr:type I restriction-modification system subunit M N-terminal domain-containing protein [Roseovarius gaetbuli]SLN19210.1 hypothetical protein ROG8370_00642 [Roseovarius gaetbuli]
MLTGTIRTQIDQIWNAFWSGGVSNQLSVIEQLTFLLFIKRLDEIHTREESKAEMDRRIFPDGANYGMLSPVDYEAEQKKMNEAGIWETRCTTGLCPAKEFKLPFRVTAPLAPPA